MRAKPLFYCENCGAEVPLNVKRCPGCGRFFDSVRCPRCGFSGSESQFAKGCPGCGYRSGGNSPKEKSAGNHGLPVWIYVMLTALATVVFAALFLALV